MYEDKSTVDEIRARFDADVERFSNLETGQVAAIDSPEHMDLLTEAAAACTPGPAAVLDVGCGAGNYTLKLLQRLQSSGQPLPAVTLVDLSLPMLDRAEQRVRAAGVTDVSVEQGDVREIDLGDRRFDIVLAAQCLHHLRGAAEWEAVFANVFRALRPGGGFWIADQVEHEHPAVRDMMWQRWGNYLVGQQDEAYCDKVMAYVEREDTPRSLAYQMQLMQCVGFTHVDVLLKRSRFASFGGIKPPPRCPIHGARGAARATARPAADDSASPPPTGPAPA